MKLVRHSRTVHRWRPYEEAGVDSSGARARSGRIDRLRDEEIRPRRGRRSEQQGGIDLEVARGNSGADKANEAKIAEVDQRAQAAAQAADTKASAAGQRADTAKTAADAAGSKAEAVDKASKRLVYEVVLSEDNGNFKFGKATMPEAATAEIDQLVGS